MWVRRYIEISGLSGAVIGLLDARQARTSEQSARPQWAGYELPSMVPVSSELVSAVTVGALMGPLMPVLGSGSWLARRRFMAVHGWSSVLSMGPKGWIVTNAGGKSKRVHSYTELFRPLD